MWIGVGLVLVMGLGGGLYAWQPWSKPQTASGNAGVGATYVVDRGNLSRSLTAYGEIVPKDEATFTFAESKLKSLDVQLGDMVQAGDVLAALDSTQEELTLVRAERALAQARAGGVPTTIRERELEYELAKASLEATTIRAPFDGVVVEAARTSGSAAGQYRIVLIDRSDLFVQISLSEADVGQVNPDQRATVSVDALPERSWPAEIVQVGLRATQASGFGGGRVVSASARLLRTDPTILPGFSARVEVVVAEARGVLRVPIEALVEHAAVPELDEEQIGTALEELGDIGSRLPEAVAGLQERQAGEFDSDQLAGIRERMAAGDVRVPSTDAAGSVISGTTGRNWAVYVLEEGGPVLRPVQIGLTTAQYAEVRAGLSEGDVVVRYPGSAQVSASGRTASNVTWLDGIFR